MPRNFEGLLCCTTICSTQLTGIFSKGIWLIYESGVVPECSSVRCWRFRSHINILSHALGQYYYKSCMYFVETSHRGLAYCCLKGVFKSFYVFLFLFPPPPSLYLLYSNTVKIYPSTL